MTYDYVRNGTTTLFAALNVLDGTVIGQCMAPSPPGIRPFSEPDRSGGAGRQTGPRDPRQTTAVHKHPKVRAWLARHSRCTFHFTPTSCSSQYRRELLATLTRRRLRRGAFHALVDRQATINRYLGEHNRKPKPFVWTANSDGIIEKVNRRYQTTASDH